jgi:hypothetical protein
VIPDVLLARRGQIVAAMMALDERVNRRRFRRGQFSEREKARWQAWTGEVLLIDALIDKALS